MELVFRKRHYTLNGGESSETHESEVNLSGLDSAVAGVLAIALAGGVLIRSYDINRLSEQLAADGRVDLAASATQRSPVRKRLDFDELSARSRDLAVITGQAEFEFREVTGEDILAGVEASSGVSIFARDPVSGVIDSITASFTTEYDPGRDAGGAGVAPSQRHADEAGRRPGPDDDHQRSQSRAGALFSRNGAFPGRGRQSKQHPPMTHSMKATWDPPRAGPRRPSTCSSTAISRRSTA